MKKIFALLIIFAAVSFGAESFAGQHHYDHHTHRYTVSGQGGYIGETEAKLTTVLEAKKMGDNAYVRLQGKLTSKTGDEKYLFRDATGTIEVEIDDEDWGGVQAGPKDTVIIEGEIDREWNSTTVDVNRVILVK